MSEGNEARRALNAAVNGDWLPMLRLRLLELAEESDTAATIARQNGQRTAAQRHTGRAQAYRHAARLAGAPEPK